MCDFPLLASLKKSIKNECDKEFGYVINVIKLVSISMQYNCAYKCMHTSVWMYTYTPNGICKIQFCMCFECYV